MQYNDNVHSNLPSKKVTVIPLQTTTIVFNISQKKSQFAFRYGYMLRLIKMNDFTEFLSVPSLTNEGDKCCMNFKDIMDVS